MKNAALSIAAPFTFQEKIAWLRLSRTENVGPITFHRLVQRYGSARKALEILPDLSRRGGRSKPLNAPSLHDIEEEYEALQKIGGDIITAAEDSYPLSLSAIDDAPPVLSFLGNPALLNRPCIAMVGARNASLNGKRFAEKIAHDLGESGHVIVSGLARGIDTAAHKGALATGTIAVVAGGIDVVYPEENQELYEHIITNGLILAESAFGQKPFAQSFPRRNRIVSGLSAATIVIEATMKSGSLITARLAGEQGRDVYAVPGHPLDPRAQGPNHLIREGATLIRSAQDVIEGIQNFSGQTLSDYHIRQAPLEFEVFEDVQDTENIQETLLLHLSHTPVMVDELIRACHVSVPVIQTALLELELAGRIKRSPGNKVSLI